MVFTLNGNSTVKTFLTGVRADQGASILTNTNTIKVVANTFNNAFYAVSGRISIQIVGGTGNNAGLHANGGIIQFGTATISATTVTRKQNGGQIYTGSCKEAIE